MYYKYKRERKKNECIYIKLLLAASLGGMIIGPQFLYYVFLLIIILNEH